MISLLNGEYSFDDAMFQGLKVFLTENTVLILI